MCRKLISNIQTCFVLSRDDEFNSDGSSKIPGMDWASDFQYYIRFLAKMREESSSLANDLLRAWDLNVFASQQALMDPHASVASEINPDDTGEDLTSAVDEIDQELEEEMVRMRRGMQSEQFDGTVWHSFTIA